MKDNSAGIFFTEEDGGVDWLWSVIEETVGLIINDIKEIKKRGGQTFDGEQRRVILEMPMTSLVGLSMGPIKTRSNRGIDCVRLLEAVSHHSIPLCCTPKIHTT